ncbi:MAG: GGDEF domain-containing protein [Burkholderiales bacterium]|nr:GGDEF domain-containing protein [Burkholderiales bacterium]
MTVPTKTNIKDVAREALRALVVRRLDPSPDNYRRLFNEIAGIEAEADSGALEEILGRIAAGFPRGSPELLRAAKALERALAKRDWNQYASLLHEATSALTRYHASAETWRTLLADLLHQLDAGHKGLTRARKKERLERALEMPANTPEQLQHKLAAIVKSWSEIATDATATESALADFSPHEEESKRAPSPALAVALAQDDSAIVCELLAQVLDVGLGGLLAYEPGLAGEAETLSRQARAARSSAEIAAVRATTKSFLLKLELTASNHADLHQGMLRLLRLVVENVAELVGDDQWLHGQIGALGDILSQPLDLVMIEHAERSMKDAVLRQGNLRHSLTEAKSAFKSMVSGFIERLGDFSTSTGDYHDRIETLSCKIAQTEDIAQLGPLLEEVSAATREVQTATLRSREETLRTQRDVQAAEQKIRDLQVELARVSAKVREDQLTGALNRRGLEEEFERSRAASERRNEPMSLALLDIDNFKALNDTHGHQAGDGALVHLARVIKSTVRPSDVVCRYGGEEFVILLPGTNLQDSVAVISRLQRELTKRFFLHDNQRLLLTFSAGVAERRQDENRDQTIQRADTAMYSAKRSGKNRVMVAA